MIANQYADEARERWGETDAYKESERRTGSYSEADWARMQAEQQANVEAFAAVLASGAGAESEEGMACAEEHRRLIDAWFYPLSYEMQINLAEMYIADSRFTEFYDKHAPGLAQFVHDAIHANAVAKS
jgi:MerR family transcriptional regulator, thiopeptide resistance regulator